MKNISVLAIIAVIAIIAIGATTAYFSDTETSIDNAIQAGTVDINIDGDNPWVGSYQMSNMAPGEFSEINFDINNIGKNPVKIWKIIKNVNYEENGITGPEQEWYDDQNGGVAKNDLDTAIVYEMFVNGNLVVEHEAGITLDKIKNYHINLVKLDKPFEASDGDGILYPGDSIEVNQKYYFKEGTENWAQTDKISFDIEILAQQVDKSEPLHQLSFIQNKETSGDWSVISDDRIGVLKYDSMALTFNYDFLGVGLEPTTEYCLIYYGDPEQGNHPGAFIGSANSNVNGKLNIIDSKDLEIDLPSAPDENYPYGAKIWLVPCGNYNQDTKSMIKWEYDRYLYDSWPGLINYKKREYSGNLSSTTKTAYLNILGGDINNQYGYQHDYSSAVNNNVYFTYDDPLPINGKLTGTFYATGLKPYATYQIKLLGIPICSDSISGDDLANEYIGYKGRWTCVSTNCAEQTALQRNRSDSSYETNKSLLDTNPEKECIVGYLVLDYFTADNNGEIVINDVDISGDTSYHVLFCGGGTCDSNGNTFLDSLDSNHSSVAFCPPEKVNGQPEPGRGGCDGLSLSSGTYNLMMSLTEESFHEGNWATVLEGLINFTIQ